MPRTDEPGGLYSPWGHKESDTSEQLSLFVIVYQAKWSHSPHISQYFETYIYLYIDTHTELGWLKYNYFVIKLMLETNMYILPVNFFLIVTYYEFNFSNIWVLQDLNVLQCYYWSFFYPQISLLKVWIEWSVKELKLLKILTTIIIQNKL